MLNCSIGCVFTNDDINYSTPGSASLFHNIYIFRQPNLRHAINVEKIPQVSKETRVPIIYCIANILKCEESISADTVLGVRYKLQWFWPYCWRRDPVCAPWCTDDVDSEFQYPFRYVSHRHFH